ncbi:MAG: hypothetical protein J1E58_09660 [Prevotella sp.]|nr:hypothetical protein [Prevotella sp.]
MMIVRRNLTVRPELLAVRELLELTKRITQTDREGFAAGLDLWQQRWKEFLPERTHDKRSGRSTRTHTDKERIPEPQTQHEVVVDQPGLSAAAHAKHKQCTIRSLH